MATEKQIEANRLNAQKSTGPTSPEGKAKSSANRLSWGFASNTTVIPGEDPREFKALTDDLLNEHQPATATEQVLVEQMAHNRWLELRAFRLQTEAFISQKLRCEDSSVPKNLALLIRYQATAERCFHRAHNELVKTQKERKKSEIGFEPQNFGQEVPTEPQPAPQKTPVTPISGPPTFTADDLDFELCPEALEFFKKRA